MNAAMDKMITATDKSTKVFSTPVGVVVSYHPNCVGQTIVATVWITIATTLSTKAVCQFKAIVVMDVFASPVTTGQDTQQDAAYVKAV